MMANKNEPSTETSTSQPRIAAVVVTYNRCALLETCLEALLDQDRPLDEILVIDNASTDETTGLLGKKYNGQVTYVRLEENLGGAGGFYEGIRLAYEKGHDWIWAMDDDLQPAPDALKALVESPAFDNPSVGLLASLVLDAKPPNQISPYQRFSGILAACPNSDGWIPVAEGHYKRFNSIMDFRLVVDQNSLDAPFVPIEAAGFLGVMVRRNAISSIGLPLKDLFLFWDDTEFIYRISRHFKVFLIPTSRVIHWHEWDIPSQRNFLGYKKKGPGIDSANLWRLYYYIRNEIFVRKKYSKPWLAPLVPAMVLTKSIVSAFLFYDYPLTRCKVLLKAGADGVLGRLGKRISP